LYCCVNCNLTLEVNRQISSLPVMTKEHWQEETATGADGSLLMSNDKQ
jgi:hypothetical protein